MTSIPDMTPTPRSQINNVPLMRYSYPSIEHKLNLSKSSTVQHIPPKPVHRDLDITKDIIHLHNNFIMETKDIDIITGFYNDGTKYSISDKLSKGEIFTNIHRKFSVDGLKILPTGAYIKDVKATNNDVASKLNSMNQKKGFFVMYVTLDNENRYLWVKDYTVYSIANEVDYVSNYFKGYKFVTTPIVKREYTNYTDLNMIYIVLMINGRSLEDVVTYLKGDNKKFIFELYKDLYTWVYFV